MRLLVLAVPLSHAVAATTAVPARHDSELPIPAGALAPAASMAQAAASAAAATSAVPATSAPCDAFCALQREKMMLTEQRDVERLKADIRKAKQDGAGGAEAASLPNGAPTAVVASRPLTGDIAFLGAGAYAGRYTATLALAGMPRDVSVGDTLDDGWRVSSITATAVELTRGKQRRWVRQ